MSSDDATATLPEKLRTEVANATFAPPAEGDGDRPDARRAVLSALLAEFAHKLRTTVKSSISWNEVNATCDAASAVGAFIDEKLLPLATSAVDENAQLGDAVSSAVLLATAPDTWPEGLASLANKQSSLSNALMSLVQSEISTFQSAAGEFTPLDMHGLGALLWLRKSITEVDLAASLLPSSHGVQFVKLLPQRITSLALADTDFCRQGKDLEPLRALCDYLRTPGCGLISVSVARNNLPNEAGVALAAALGGNTTLTMLDATGNAIGGSAAAELAAAAVKHPALTTFGGVPMAAMRTDSVDSMEPDLSAHGMRAAEAGVLAALLPLAWKVAGVNIDGELLPVRKFRGGAPSADEAKRLRAAALEAGALKLLHSQENAGENGVDPPPLKHDGADEPAESEVDLAKLNLSVASAVVMGSLLEGNGTLRALNLGYNKLGAEGVAALARGLSKNGKLELLNLCWNRITWEGAKTVAASLHGNASLTSLNLACNELCGINSFGQGTFNADGVQALAEALEHSAVKSLDLSNNGLVGMVGMSGRTLGNFKPDALEALADCLPGSPVRELILDGNQIGAEGTGVLAGQLARHTSLEMLSLADCNVSDAGKDTDGLTELVGALKGMGQLRELCLDGCNVGSKGAQIISSAFLKHKPASFENLYLERTGNQIDKVAEDMLRQAAGDNICLHLERGRPQYQASLDKSEALISQELAKRRGSVTGDAGALLAAKTGGTGAANSALGALLSSDPSPPPDGAKRSPQGASPRANGARGRRGSCKV